MVNCRDCDAENIDVDEIPIALSTSEQRRVRSIAFHPNRQLQDAATCYCSAQAIGDRAPYEAEFVDAYQEYVEALGADCNSYVADCSFGTTFDTGIVISFNASASEISDDDIKTIEESFLESINALYENTEETCNPDLRMIESVEATLATNATRRI